MVREVVQIVRVHDVEETKDALNVIAAIKGVGGNENSQLKV
jgi:dihydropteroate synthase